MYNKIILVGRLTRDPELKYTPEGTAVTKFTLAVDRRRKDDGADFVDIVTWRGTAEACANYLAKGSLVMVDGRLEIKPYENRDGEKRKSVNVIAGEVKFLQKSGGGNGGGEQKQQDGTNWDDIASEIDVGDDDIPF